MTCPEDAKIERNEEYDSRCSVKNIVKGNYGKREISCTRTKGHTGDHHAHNRQGECVGVWANENEPEPELNISVNIPKGVLDLFGGD